MLRPDYMWLEGPARTWVFLLCESEVCDAFRMVGKIVVGLPRAEKNDTMIRVYEKTGGVVFSAIKSISRHVCPKALDELLVGEDIPGYGIVTGSVVEFFCSKGLQVVQVL